MSADRPRSPDEDRVVPGDALTAEDRNALGWAVSAELPVAATIVERVRGGGSDVTVDELAAVHRAWEAAGRPVPRHHVHRSPVGLADGTIVLGVTFFADDPYTRGSEPSFGLYLDERWDPPWPHAHLDWPDFGVPDDVSRMRGALVDLLTRARQGQSVEVGCLGGHGRTGTALACLAILTGTPAAEAVAWVRSNYCEKAVETDQQVALVQDFEA
jgi:hypothetical protein